MNPELEQLKKRVADLEDFINERKEQQISNPLDVASRRIIGAPTFEAAGSTTLSQTLNLTGNAQQISLPTGFAQSVVLIIDGVRYEFPSLI
jgi:hypothetical protein